MHHERSHILIYFFTDDHYQASPGKHIYNKLPIELKEKIVFQEDQWDLLESGDWEKDCELLILHMISDTCNQPIPGKGAENAVRKYCERGGNMLLLHASSAAFWHWQWWRNIVGLRWVRPNDPDGIIPSSHPKIPSVIEVSKVRHPLVSKLKKIVLPKDEVFVDLEQMNPITVLMETSIYGETYPQAYECETPWKGKILSFIPGHIPQSTENPDLIWDVSEMIRYLLA